MGGEMGGEMGVEVVGREGEGIGDERVGGAVDQSYNELGSWRLLSRQDFLSSGLAKGRTMEGKVEGTGGNEIARGILGVVKTRGEIDCGTGETDLLENSF